MLWILFAFLMILWLLGWGFQIGGAFVHILLVVALIIAAYNVVAGHKTMP